MSLADRLPPERTTRSPRAWLGLAVRLTLGFGALIYALRGVDLVALADAIKGLDPLWLAIAFLAVLASIGVKFWRWELLVSPVCPQQSSLSILRSLLLGQAANIVLPLRGGDLVRAAVLAPSGGRLAAVLAVTVVEKALDLIALGLAAAAAMLLIWPGSVAVSWPGMFLLGLALLLAALVIMSSLDRVWARLRPVLKRLPANIAVSAQKFGDGMVDGIGELRRARHMPPVIALTLLSWLVMFSINIALLKSFAIPAPAGAALLVLVLVHIGVIPALMPGNIGPFYFFARLALTTYGISAAASTGFAVVLHAIITLPPMIGAGLALLMSKTPGKRA